MMWELRDSSGIVRGSGPLNGSNFMLTIPGSLIQDPNFYSLSLSGDCGQTSCLCVVRFIVEECVPFDCQNFDDMDQGAWVGNQQYPSSTLGATVSLGSPGPSGLATDKYLRGEDESGSSLVINTGDYNFDWTQRAGECFCFDMKVEYDANNSLVIPINPAIILYNNPTYPNTPYLSPAQSAVFFANYYVTENSDWVRVCVPIDLCDANGNLPSNANGQWQMASGSTCADWQTLLQNITHVGLKIDYYPNPAEIIYWDNFCFETCPADTVFNCANLQATATPALPPSTTNEGCCWEVDLENNTGLNNISSAVVQIITPGVEFLSFNTNNGFYDQNAFPNPNRRRKIGHSTNTIPSGLSSNAVSFCLDGITSSTPDPIMVVVVWNQSLAGGIEFNVCRDTLLLQCQSPPYSCPQTCLSSVLNISTGYDPVSNSILPPGNSDPLWTTVAVPASSTVAPYMPANIIGPYGNSWSNPTGSNWISAVPFNNYSINNCSAQNCSCDPFIYQRFFCQCADSEVTFNFEFLNDDAGEVELWDANSNTLVASLVSTCSNTYNFINPVQVNETLFLPEGSYCLRIKHWNTNSHAMGVNLKGTVTGLGLQKDTCCIAPLGSIVGTKYWDKDCDGVRDFNEPRWQYIDPGLSGWTFTLSKDDVISTAVSDANGQFQFVNLEPGTYTVSETPQPGFSPSIPQNGIASVTVTSFGITEVSFGNCREPLDTCDLITVATVEDTTQTGCCHELTIYNQKPD
jgi:hypothetical protein